MKYVVINFPRFLLIDFLIDAIKYLVSLFYIFILF